MSSCTPGNMKPIFPDRVWPTVRVWTTSGPHGQSNIDSTSLLTRSYAPVQKKSASTSTYYIFTAIFNSLRPRDTVCVSKLTIIGPDNGLSPGRHQAIIWTNAGILLIPTLGTNFSEILIEINTFSLKKMHLEISSGKRRPSCLGPNVLMTSSGQQRWCAIIDKQRN